MLAYGGPLEQSSQVKNVTFMPRVYASAWA